MGVLRSLQLVLTIVVVGPIAVLGLLTLADGEYVQGMFFVAAAIGLLGLSEYIYLRITDRVRSRLTRFRQRNE